MKKYQVVVNGEAFTVEVEEIASSAPSYAPAPPPCRACASRTRASRARTRARAGNTARAHSFKGNGKPQ
jgi:hypothetical protein